MIELKKILKEFIVGKNDRVVALDNIDIKIKGGELVVLKGASGSGKSTVLSLIAGLSKPTSGEVIVDKKQISKLPDKFASVYRRDNIGFVFQKYNLIIGLSVKENIIIPQIPSNPDQKELEKKVSDLISMFELDGKEDLLVQNLSGGEQQRVAIARSIINDPKIIIADEPTANLDENLSREFINILKKLKAMDKTIIVATHDPLFFDLEFVDKMVEMKKGKIIK
jgi:putative ABC transport system ATP-binding protein